MTNPDEQDKLILASREHSLVKHSAALIRRGLESLSKVVWQTRLVQPTSSVSPSGQICSSSHSWIMNDNKRGHITEHLVKVASFDKPSANFTMAAPAAFPRIQTENGWEQISVSSLQLILANSSYSPKGYITANAESAVSYAWSPCGTYLITGSGNHERALRLFDVHGQRYVECFGGHGDNLYNLAWSSSGEYFASASTCYDPHLKLWRCQWNDSLFGRKLEGICLVGEVVALDFIPQHHYDKQEGKWCGLYGFQGLTFCPQSSVLAVVASIGGKDDNIVIFEIPSLKEIQRIPIAGELHTISWLKDGISLLFTTWEREVFKLILDLPNNQVTSTGLSFDICRCHPTLDFVAFAQGRYVESKYEGGLISIRKLSDFSLVSEFTAPSGISDLCWSSDGNKLWAISDDGTVVQGELPIVF